MMELNYKELKKQFRKRDKELEEKKRYIKRLEAQEDERQTITKQKQAEKTDQEHRKQMLWEYLVGK